MSKYVDVQFEVGDEFALSPAGASRIISSILAAGGEFELDGDIVRIVRLPDSKVGIKMEAPPVASPPEPAPEPPVAAPPVATPSAPAATEPAPAATEPAPAAPAVKSAPEKAVAKPVRKPTPAADEKK